MVNQGNLNIHYARPYNAKKKKLIHKLYIAYMYEYIYTYRMLYIRVKSQEFTCKTLFYLTAA